MKLRRRSAVSRLMRGDTHSEMQQLIAEADDGNKRKFASGAGITPSTLYRGLKTRNHDFDHNTMDLARAYHRKRMVERATLAETAETVPAGAAPDRETLELAIRAGQDIGLPLTAPLLAFLASGTYVALVRMRERGVPLEGAAALEAARSVAEALAGSYTGGELDQSKPE